MQEHADPWPTRSPRHGGPEDDALRSGDEKQVEERISSSMRWLNSASQGRGATVHIVQLSKLHLKLRAFGWTIVGRFGNRPRIPGRFLPIVDDWTLGRFMTRDLTASMRISRVRAIVSARLSKSMVMPSFRSAGANLRRSPASFRGVCGQYLLRVSFSSTSPDRAPKSFLALSSNTSVFFIIDTTAALTLLASTTDSTAPLCCACGCSVLSLILR